MNEIVTPSAVGAATVRERRGGSDRRSALPYGRGSDRVVRPAWWLFALGWLVGFLQMTHPAGWGFGQGFEMSAIARSLAANGTFADPFDPFVTGLTAVVPPLHPFVMGLVYRLVPGPSAGTVLSVANVLANA